MLDLDIDKKKFKFTGHETFAFRFAWLPKAVEAVQRDPMLFSNEDEAMIQLGVGKNMVRSIRFWGQQTGIVEAKEKEYHLTRFGKIVFGVDGDPYLENEQTLWLLHWQLTTNPSALYIWPYLLNFWHEPELISSAILKSLKRDLGNTVKLSDSSLSSMISVFFHTYSSTEKKGKDNTFSEDNLDSPLVLLHLLEKVGYRSSYDNKPEMAYQFRRSSKPEISQKLFAYTLINFWRKHAPDEKTLSFYEIIRSVGAPGHIFKMPEDELKRRLENIAEVTSGLLTYSSSALLPSIYRKKELTTSILFKALDRIYE